MKRTVILQACALAAVALMSGSCNESKAQAQTLSSAAAESHTPPIGAQAEVFVDSGTTATPISSNRNGDARGKLIVANAQWVALREGTSETWIPRERVVLLKLIK